MYSIESHINDKPEEQGEYEFPYRRISRINDETQ
jgi:hypothetical protein